MATKTEGKNGWSARIATAFLGVAFLLELLKGGCPYEIIWGTLVALSTVAGVTLYRDLIASAASKNKGG